MNSPANNRPVILIRKRAPHGRHHGGAWKVAYADFVTAMMALFIVLWLLSSNEEVKKAVGGYFQDPTGNGNLMGRTMEGNGTSLQLGKEDMKDLREKLQQTLKNVPALERLSEQVQMTVTGEGLRIELMESEQGSFFQTGSGTPSPSGREFLIELAQELGGLPNGIVIEGHTDSNPFGGNSLYTNWELSTDRANAARRIMQENGLSTGQVLQLRGFADTRLRNLHNPADSSNRRITVIVEYLDLPRKDQGQPEPPSAGTGPKPAGSGTAPTPEPARQQ